MRRMLIGLVTVATFGAVLAACGGDSGGDTADQVDSGDGQTDGTSDGGGVASTIGDVLGISEECESLVNLLSVTGQILGGQIPADAARETIDTFIAAVPSEIEADAKVFADAYMDWVTLLGKYNSDLTAAFTDPEAAAISERLNDAETSGAFERINEYAATECAWMGQ